MHNRNASPTPATRVRPSSSQVLSAFAGSVIGIGMLALLASRFDVPLLMAPFGASCALLFAVPDAPLSQPRNVVFGHLVSCMVGMLAFRYLGTGPLEMGLAVGLAIAAMQVTRTLHAPAGANPIVVFLAGGPPWSYLLSPVLLGALLLVLVALVINNLGRGKSWPKYWW